MEQRLKSRLQAEIKSGSLNLHDIEALGAFYASSRRQQEELRGLLATYITHLLFVLLVPLSIRLLLTGQLYFFRKDLAALGIAGLGLLILAHTLRRLWPVAPFTHPTALWDFVLAYLGDRNCGSWKAECDELNRLSWNSGIDSTTERKEKLRDWHLTQSSNFNQRRAFLENCLGPGELLMTCFFGLTLLTMPLLSHFRALVPL